MTADEADRAETEARLPAEPDDRNRPRLHDPDEIPRLASELGTARTDLVVLEIDEAVGWPAWRPGGFSLYRPAQQILARYRLVPQASGGYRLDPPWNPRYPRSSSSVARASPTVQNGGADGVSRAGRSGT
ncbi:hypothetical protein ACIB24_18440 [Spongisporangium articulatum]|uniref:Uncharacterized protein n=1 Tax=Spongisporangium articulatum TaxID=3362603 RepID=A0ABW8ARM3_9ACTN